MAYLEGSFLLQSCSMPAPLSLDLRQRIVQALETDTLSQAAIAQRFGVGKATVERLARLRRTTGSIAPKPYTHGPKPIVPTEHFGIIEQWLKADPDLSH